MKTPTKFTVLPILFVVMFLLISGQSFGKITRNLENYLATVGPEDEVSCLVMMTEQADVKLIGERLDAANATRAERHLEVLTALQQTASETQPAMVSYLEAGRAEGKVSNYNPFWIVNGFRVDASASFIRELALRNDVRQVTLNYFIEGIEPTEVKESGEGDISSIEEGLERINAPAAWARGYTGVGRLVSHIDSGVDGNHPALSARWRGNHEPWWECWYEPNYGSEFPNDGGLSYGHGTHTMGTICGYDQAGDQHIGVAYDAEWISAGVIDRINIPTTMSDALASFQWLADPDGNPQTTDDVPDVCSNSWGISPIYHGQYIDGPCDEYFWEVIDNCEAAGVVVVFAAGNEGWYGSNTLRTPADRGTTDYTTFSVGAIDGSNYGNNPIASFSSLGPSPCGPNGEWVTKPEVVAPGVDVRSSYPGGGYTTMSGTSMACPHVAGAVALLRQANPDASHEMIKEALMMSAQDLGNTGEDNTYGWGLIDVDAAIDYLGGGCGDFVSIEITPDNPPIVIPQEGGSFTFDGEVRNGDVPGSYDIWSYVMVPGTGYYGPVRRYDNVWFDSCSSRSASNLSETVPGMAPEGVYTYVACVGDYGAGVVEDSSYFTFRKQGEGGGPYSVVILKSDYDGNESWLQDVLMNDGRFIAADHIDVRNYTPTLSELQAYDIVVTWTNYTYADPVAIGNVLADFVDQGGAVVACTFSFYAGWTMQGRWMDDSNYSPINPGSSYDWNTQCMDWYDPSHPIMEGVSAFCELYNVNITVRSTGTLVADYTNGNPLCVYNTDAPQNVILNWWPGTSNPYRTGDDGVMIANACAYAGDNSARRIGSGAGEVVDDYSGGVVPLDLPKSAASER